MLKAVLSQGEPRDAADFATYMEVYSGIARYGIHCDSTAFV